MVQVPEAIKSLIPLVLNAGVKAAKKKLFFHQICQQLNIDKFEDDFDFAYLHTLAIFLIDKSPDWAILFDLPESRTIFKKCHPNSNYEEFEKHLDLHLHITIKQGGLKPLDRIPDGLIVEFVGLYSELISEHMTPLAEEVVREVRIIRARSEEQHNVIMGLLTNKPVRAVKSRSPRMVAGTENPKVIPWSESVEVVVEQLRDLYRNDKIQEALQLAESFLAANREDGINKTILSHIFKLKMRWGSFPGIRKQIKELKSYEKYPDFKELFQARLFECELRDSYNVLPNYDAFHKKLEDAQNFLEEIPEYWNSEMYYYLTGRCFMERWWAYRSETKTNLDHALTHLRLANPDDWWVESYICMVLKLLGREYEFNQLVHHHREVMMDKLKAEPNRASFKIHVLNVLILMDDQTHELADQLESISKPTSSNDLNGSLLHYINVIYHNDDEKREKYQKLIKSWK